MDSSRSSMRISAAKVSGGRFCQQNQFLDRISNLVLLEDSKWHLFFLEQGLLALPKLEMVGTISS